jgi:hypothetical protein
MSVSRQAWLVLAGLALAALAACGHPELALTAAPVVLISAAPLVGRFPGEQLIVARRAVRVGRRRPQRRVWPPRRERTLTSLLERSACTLRGPPVAA